MRTHTRMHVYVHVTPQFSQPGCNNSTMITADSKYYKFGQMYQTFILAGSATAPFALPPALNTCSPTIIAGVNFYAKMTNECVMLLYDDALCTILANPLLQPGSLWKGDCEVNDDTDALPGTYKKSYCINFAPTTIATYTDLSLANSLLTVTTPTPAPLVAAKKDDDVCFTGEMTVQHDDGSTKRIAETKIGDKILTVVEDRLVYAEVVFIPHKDSEKMDHAFYSFSTASGHTLEASESHLIPVAHEKDGSCDYLDEQKFLFAHSLVYASEVTKGVCVGVVHNKKLTFEAVASVTTATRKTELVSIVTTYAGYPVVNGIAASSFSMNHAIPSMFYNIHRALFRVGLGGLLDSSAVKCATHAIGRLAVNVHQALF